MKPQIPLPGKLTFEKWAEQFISNYPNENIAFPKHRSHWTEWGSLLIPIEKFSKIPTPLRSFYGENWQDWAVLMITNLGDE